MTSKVVKLDVPVDPRVLQHLKTALLNAVRASDPALAHRLGERARAGLGQLSLPRCVSIPSRSSATTNGFATKWSMQSLDWSR